MHVKRFKIGISDVSCELDDICYYAIGYNKIISGHQSRKKVHNLLVFMW